MMLIWSELKSTSCSPDLKANSKSCLTNFLTNELELVNAFVEQDNFHDDPHADLVRILENLTCSPDPKTNFKIR